jgi:hypothetical protein
LQHDDGNGGKNCSLAEHGTARFRWGAIDPIVSPSDEKYEGNKMDHLTLMGDKS